MATDEHALIIQNAVLTGDYDLAIATGTKKAPAAETHT
jgi:hypothetical protein